jgi:membrane-bound lytic murein transglycosylase D
MNAREVRISSPPTLKVSFRTTLAEQQSFRFSKSFRIGRVEECDICINNDYVSRIHAEVVFENGAWWVHDLNSSNGLYIGGQRIERAPVGQATVIRLGIYGTEVSLEVEAAPAENKAPMGSETMVARYVEHYFGKSAKDNVAGEHTIYMRKAFRQVQTKQKRRYGQVIAALVLVALGAAAYALYLHQQVRRQRAMAQDLFYTMKSLDVDIASLEKALLDSNSQQGTEVIRKYESRRQEMEKGYDQYLATLHVYNPRMTEQERLVLRVARIFGECELNMPPDFAAEVNKYIKLWQSSGRLTAAVRIAQQNSYADVISKELLARGLPPQFFYLALQESNFDPYVSGPMTRKGIAKGMWQFVPETAAKYGLRLGPLVDLRRPDPGDERDHYEKATQAAARYLRDLYSTDAQASGFLVMACYNWGEDQVLPLVRSMPANPRERNFWKLLSNHRDRIPKETYDYVFYIISAAVIGENPRLFGFDFDNPLANLESK